MRTTSARAFGVWAIVSLILLGGGLGYADPTTVNLTGSVTYTELPGMVPEGSPVTVQYTYDDAAGPYRSVNFLLGGAPTPAWHVYDFTFGFDGSTITAQNADLYLVDNGPGGGDSYIVYCGGLAGTLPTGATGNFATATLGSSDFNFMLADYSGTALNSPLAIPDPTTLLTLFSDMRWGNTWVEFPGVGHKDNVEFDITGPMPPATVPVPGALALGLIGLLFARRRLSQHAAA